MAWDYRLGVGSEWKIENGKWKIVLNFALAG